MNTPPFKTRLFGHPIMVLPMAGATLWSVYQTTQDSNFLLLTVLLAVLMAKIMTANEQMAAYKAWKRAWDDMDKPASVRASPRGPRYVVAVTMVGGVAAYLAATPDQPGHSMALGWMALVAIGALAAWAWRVLRRRSGAKRDDQTTPVRVCVKGPLLAVPSLTDAYRALPAYCWQVLDGGKGA